MSFNEEAKPSKSNLSRRRFLIGLVGGSATALLAACGGSQPAAQAPAAPTQAPAAQEQAPADSNEAPSTEAPAATSSLSGEVSVRFFPFGTGVEEIYQGFADEFQAENPGVKVTLDLQPWDNRYPKMLADLAAGQGPDVMFITTDVLIRFANADVIAPIEDYLPAESWEGYSDALLDEVSLDGKRWFVPMDQEVPIWIANMDIMERVGYTKETLPGTWDEIREMCARVADLGDPNLWGWNYSASSTSLNTSFYPFLYQAGGRPISEDGSTPTFNSDAGVEALDFIVELFDKNWSSQQYLQPIESGQDPFTLGQQALSQHNFIATLVTLRKTVPDMRYAIGPVVSHKEAWGFGGRRSWAISKTARNIEAAAAFTAFLTRPDIMARHAEPFGTFPAKSSANELVYKDDPEIAAMAERMPQIFGEQKHKYGRDLMPLVIPEIQAAILKQKSSKQALDDAAKAVSEMFAKG